jgi:cyclopropane fatty-acyl-phospholipid synthase-like methyltransferase
MESIGHLHSGINQEYLDGQYLLKNPSFHVEDSPWKAGQILKMLQLCSLQPATIAEVGCGAGEILVQLSRKLPSVRLFGYELSPQGFQLCQERQTERVQYFQVDILKQTHNRYDLVLCIDVFEHIEDYFSFLRALKERGRAFIFHVPLDMNAQMVARGEPISRVRSTVGHLHYFSKETALAALRDCGYAIRSWFFTPNGVDRPKSPKARLLQVPRKLCCRAVPELTVRLLGGYSLLVLATPKDM